MTHDPFDTLRSRNPAPPESLPEAPMTVASRIAAGHPSLRRGLAIATAAAAVVLVAGGGWLLWSQTGGRQTVVGPTTTTSTAPATPADAAPIVVVYFLDGDSNTLVPVARNLNVLNVRPLPDLGPLTVELLLFGPGAWDAAPLDPPVAAAEAELTSEIPEGTQVLGLTVEDGVATVDLSAEFADASPQAIAQVVYTLTGLDGVAQVAFSIEGVPQVVGSFTSGLFTPYLEPADTGAGMDWVDRELLSPFAPVVMIEHPALGGTLRAGEAVILITRGEDATLTLTAADGTLLWNAWAPHGGEPPYLPPEVIMAAGGYGTWATLRAEAEGTGAAAEIPVWLEPTVPFVDEPDIPEATTTTVPSAMDEVPELVVYFLKDGALIPVARDLRVLNVSPLPDLGPLALDLLLWGPGAWDAGPLPGPVAAAEAELTSEIPEGTQVLGLAVEDGVATVDLSTEFTEASPAALAQVVFTLTGPWQDAEAVRFLIEGVPQGVTSPYLDIYRPHLVPASVSSSHADPVNRPTFAYLMGAGGVASPPLGGTLRDPWPIFGMARGPVDQVGVRVAELDGSVLYEEVQEITDSACNPWYGACNGTDDWDRFVGTVPETRADLGRWVTLTCFLVDEAGVETALTSWPVWLEPSVPFTDEPDIPEATTTVGFGLGDLRPFPDEMLTGCAAETARDLASFETALGDGPLSMEDLCALVGMPDWETGSGLWIPVYDLADGSRLYLGYTGPNAGDLIYANLVSRNGEMRDLLGG